MQMQMLMQSLPVSKLNNLQNTEGLESAESKNSESGFLQMLGKAMNAESANGDSAEGDNSEDSIEDLLSGFFGQGNKLLEEFGQELKALLTGADGSFEWSGDGQALLNNLPEQIQELAEMMKNADETKRMSWVEGLLGSSGNSGSSEMLADLQDFLNEKGKSELAEKVGKLNSGEEKLASSFTVLLTLVNQTAQASDNTGGQNGMAPAQKGADFLSSLSSLVSSFMNDGKQQEAASPRKMLNQLAKLTENLSGQQTQLKSMEGMAQAWRQSSSETDAKQHYLQQLLNRGLSSTDTATSKSQPASLSSQDSTGVMAKAQQALLHLGEGKTEHARTQEFMKQFQDLLGKSNLQSFKNGTQQLTVKLVPESLGRLDIKILQQNGQMTAQLMTTTSSAREMVESQLHQLRAAFHQQNIQVDRIDIAQQQPSTLQEETGDQEEQQENLNGSSLEDEENAENEESFADVLDEITFNEQV